mmetsp:Transcript_86208/g.222031  ORF Transcript_86208/g.222031 Transcript_86208/m.222031 type:complete len:431 (+) Transcript_86208:159-1451(+)
MHGIAATSQERRCSYRFLLGNRSMVSSSRALDSPRACCNKGEAAGDGLISASAGFIPCVLQQGRHSRSRRRIHPRPRSDADFVDTGVVARAVCHGQFELRLDQSPSVDRPQAGVCGDLALALHHHDLLVQLDLVLVDLQAPLAHALGRGELVLVWTMLEAGQSLHGRGRAIGRHLPCLHQDFLRPRVGDDDDDVVHDARVLDQRGLARDELRRELLDGLRALLAVLRGRDVVERQVFAQRLLAEADRRLHQGGDVLLTEGELDVLRLGLLRCHPLEELGVARRVLLAPGAARWQAYLEKVRSVSRGEHNVDNLLAVDRRHARVRGRGPLLLYPPDLHEVQLDVVALHAEEVRQDALRSLLRVLVGLLLLAGEEVVLTGAAIREDLLRLHQEAVLPLRADAQDDDVDHAHQLLVLGGVQHEAGRATSDLLR